MIQSKELRGRLLDLVKSDGSDADDVRRDLERRLTPLVRVALRHGVGIPALVRWVRAALSRFGDSGPPSGPPERCTPQITRLLCAALLHDSPTGANVRPQDRKPLAAW